MTPVKAIENGIALSVRLTPKGGRDAIDGLTDTPAGPALKARVSVPPEDGKANAALEKLVANWLDEPRSNVRVAAGNKSRNKTLHIAGDPAALQARIAVLLARTG
ncbi:MAG: DUF167 family protein [Beijerinckiaceae bacterium]